MVCYVVPGIGPEFITAYAKWRFDAVPGLDRGPLKSQVWESLVIQGRQVPVDSIFSVTL